MWNLWGQWSLSSHGYGADDDQCSDESIDQRNHLLLVLIDLMKNACNQPKNALKGQTLGIK